MQRVARRVRNAEGARRNNELATIAAWHCGKLRTSKDNKAERRDENSIPTAARPRLRISHLLYTIFTPSCEYKTSTSLSRSPQTSWRGEKKQKRYCVLAPSGFAISVTYVTGVLQILEASRTASRFADTSEYTSFAKFFRNHVIRVL
jgi:hypothetical protein